MPFFIHSLAYLQFPHEAFQSTYLTSQQLVTPVAILFSELDVKRRSELASYMHDVLDWKYLNYGRRRWSPLFRSIYRSIHP